MRRIFISLVIACGLAVASSAAEGPEQIAAVSQRVADWQLAHMDKLQPGMPPESLEPRGWVVGALMVGLTALADQSDNPRYAQAIYARGAMQQWKLGDRPFHADDHVIGQTWIWAYEHWLDPKMIAPVRTRFDEVIAAAPHNSLDFTDQKTGMEAACQDRWCWADALFMGPPGWFELARATGDHKYIAYADKEFWATYDRLFSPEDSLFYRDTRFIGQKGPHGEKIFWSRGNGWVYAGVARILQFLPADAPERPRYLELFRRMSARLVALQKPDGYWPASLEAPAESTPPETSGTGFFTFGLAYGVASGILTEPKYRAAAERGWEALVKAVEPDGKLGWVQRIGGAPDSVQRDDTQLYGVGAFLLAGAAMIDMEAPHPVVTLTLHNPLKRERMDARVEIPQPLSPRNAADWVAVLDRQIVPLQSTPAGAIAVLDVPAKASAHFEIRRRFGFDPPPKHYAGALIPVKVAGQYENVPVLQVPPSHAIHDDLLPFEGAGWESDRIAYRVYLDKRFSTDIFGKKLPGPILNFIGRGGPSYHDEADWGMDIWRVGDRLGAGGLGVLRNGMATQLGEMKDMRAAVAESGPVLADIHVDCTGFDAATKNLSADFQIAAGSRLFTATASAPGVLLVAGFAKWPDTTFITSPKGAKGWAYFATWGVQSEFGHDVVGAALFYPVREIARTGDDGRSVYVVFKNPAKARYAFAGVWARDGGGLSDEASFRAYLDRSAAELSHPVFVTK
jgi:rhamnogalacturonyl hydrolase YesR